MIYQSRSAAQKRVDENIKRLKLGKSQQERDYDRAAEQGVDAFYFALGAVVVGLMIISAFS